MTWGEYKEMVADIDTDDDVEVEFLDENGNIIDINVACYDPDDNVVRFECMPDDATFRLTEQALFGEACSFLKPFKDYNWIENKKFEKIWTLFEFQMREHGYYVKNGEEPKPISGNPEDFIESAFKEAGVKLQPGDAERIYEKFVEGLKAQGYLDKSENNA